MKMKTIAFDFRNARVGIDIYHKLQTISNSPNRPDSQTAIYMDF